MRKRRSGASVGLPTHTGGFGFLQGWKKTSIGEWMRLRKKSPRRNLRGVKRYMPFFGHGFLYSIKMPARKFHFLPTR